MVGVGVGGVVTVLALVRLGNPAPARKAGVYLPLLPCVVDGERRETKSTERDHQHNRHQHTRQESSRALFLVLKKPKRKAALLHSK